MKKMRIIFIFICLFFVFQINLFAENVEVIAVRDGKDVVVSKEIERLKNVPIEIPADIAIKMYFGEKGEYVLDTPYKKCFNGFDSFSFPVKIRNDEYYKKFSYSSSGGWSEEVLIKKDVLGINNPISALLICLFLITFAAQILQVRLSSWYDVFVTLFYGTAIVSSATMSLTLGYVFVRRELYFKNFGIYALEVTTFVVAGYVASFILEFVIRKIKKYLFLKNS